MWLTALAAADFLCLPAPALAQHEELRDIDTTSATLAGALAELSRETGISVGMTGPLPAVRVPPVRGRMRPETALRRLLRDTDIRAVRIGPMAFRLERVAGGEEEAAAPPALGAPAAVAEADIVVTGLKRRLELSTLAVPVTVVPVRGNGRLRPVPASTDLADQVDGLTFTNLGPGRNRPFIRGVADSPFIGTSQSTVSVQVDEIRVTYDAPDPDLRLVDVDRVEILKGPQGPLYGSGALGGVYHIVTRRPNLSAFEATMGISASAIDGAGLGQGGRVIVNLPLFEGRLGLRAAGYAAHEPGWIDNEDGRRNSNDALVAGGRLALRWRPDNVWTVDLAGIAQFIDAHDSQYVFTEAREGPLTRPNNIPEPHDNDFINLSATVTGRIGRLRLVSATGWVAHDTDSILDASAAAGLFGLSGKVRFSDDRTHHLFDQELRLSSDPAERLAWVAGLSYLSAYSDLRGDLIPESGPESGVAERIVSLHRHVEEYAAFAEMSLPLGGAFTATAGGRLFHSRTSDERAKGERADRLLSGKTGFTPSLSLSWAPCEGRFFYLRYSSALRPGGLSASAEGDNSSRFSEDELKNFDLGSRLSLGGGRLSVEANLYVTLWDHIQSDYLLDNGLVATRNAGDGLIYGLEALMRWTPGGGWRLETGITAQRARLERPAPGLDISGDQRLPVVPDLNLRFALGRRIVIGGWTGEASARLHYYGSSRLSFDRDLDRHMGNYAVAGTGLSLGRNGWSARAQIDNLLDIRGDSFAFGNPFSIMAARQYTPLRPRTFRLGLERSW